MKILRLAWDRLLIITAVYGDAQGRLLASLFYFTVLVPFGIGVRMFSDPLQRAEADKQSHWLERPAVSRNLDDARRQG